MKQRNYNKNNKCLCCGKKICDSAERCHQCANNTRKGKEHYNIGKDHPNYKDGRTNKTYYCIDCGKKVSRFSGCYGNCRCLSCETKRKWNLKLINLKDKKLSRKARKNMSIARKGKYKGKQSPRFGKIALNGKRIYYKQSCMRSTWETAFAKYCIINHIKYRYEPKVFDLGNMTYRPDFYLFEQNLWIEIKGWWRDKAKQKFNLFKKIYPNKKIKVLMKPELKQLGVL